jgi:hypothetical protein
MKMKNKEKNRLNTFELSRKEERRMKKLSVFVVMISLSITSLAYDKRVLIYDQPPRLEKIFKEPFEVMAIYCENGKTITVTSFLENQVNGTLEEIEHYLALVNSDLGSAKYIIHNHLTPRRWSLTDKKFYRRLRKEGFKGRFILYFPWCRSLKYIEGQKSTVRVNSRSTDENPKKNIS